jgi:hypothetical protein
MLPGDVLKPATGNDPNCNVTASFATPPAGTTTSRTITLTAVYPIGNRPIWETGSASETITVAPLAAGVFIGQTVPPSYDDAYVNPPGCGGFNQPPCPPRPAPSILNNLTVTVTDPHSYDPMTVQLSGWINPAMVNTTTTWTGDKGSGPIPLGTGLNANLTLNYLETYQVTMTTVDRNGTKIGSATFKIHRPVYPK